MAEPDKEQPSSSLPAVVHKRAIVWGDDGVPRPEAVPALTPQGISELSTVALSLPFVPRGDAFPEDKEFEGMTNAEVMVIRLARAAASGDLSATSQLLDRVLGKPKQSVESKSLTLTYADVLKEKAERMKNVRSSSPPPARDSLLDGLI